MATVSGDLGNLIGGSLTFPNGRSARAYLSPSSVVQVVGDELRLGGIEVTLDDDGLFSTGDVASGDWQLIVLHYDWANRKPTITTILVDVFGNTVVTA